MCYALVQYTGLELGGTGCLKRWVVKRLDTSDELPSGFARLEDASDERIALLPGT